MEQHIKDILPSRIIRMACEFEGITEQQLETRRRKAEYIMVQRYITYCLMFLGFSTKMIGKLILRDHASIIHYKKGLLDEQNGKIQNKLREFRYYMRRNDVVVPSLENWKEKLTERNIKLN